MMNASRQSLRGYGIKMEQDLFQLNDRFIRLHIVPLGGEDSRDLPIDRRRDLAFHLHRFNNQQRIAGLDLIIDGDQDFYDAAWHRWRDVARFGRLWSFWCCTGSGLRGFRNAGQDFPNGFEGDLLEFVVDSDVVGFSPVSLSA